MQIIKKATGSCSRRMHFAYIQPYCFIQLHLHLFVKTYMCSEILLLVVNVAQCDFFNVKLRLLGLVGKI